MSVDILEWLRDAAGGYQPALDAVYKRAGDHEWPLVAKDEDELYEKLLHGNHFVPLPKEPAALANLLEVSLVDYILDEVSTLAGASAVRGTERGYPDIEISGSGFGGGHFAVDVKVAQRAKSGGNRTQSRITLYTGNTYFRYPQLHWPNTFRPFQDYKKHIDLIVLYTLDSDSLSRIRDPEVLVQESWRIGSKQRSSTTREYIGAVQSIDDLRNGHGEFASEDQFYAFWRKYPFNVGRAVQKQLDKLLAQQLK